MRRNPLLDPESIEYNRREVAEMPPLTTEQLLKLRRIFNPTGYGLRGRSAILDRTDDVPPVTGEHTA